MEWCTIESDPGCFTELMEKIGVEGVQMQEIYSLDDDTFASLPPVYGLIFLFKWRASDYKQDSRPTIAFGDAYNLFFARQIVNNACATQAILSILLNITDPSVNIGPILSNFKSFTSEFTPELKGQAIGATEEIRIAHNSFSRPESIVSERSKKATATEKDDVFHFISYVPMNNKAYELDGLKEGPIHLGDFESNNWIQAVRPAIQQRIEQFASGEVHFNLMALIKSPALEAKAKREIDLAKLSSIEGESEEKNQLKQQIEEWDRIIANDEDKVKNWKLENQRRRHNYIPFIVKLLKTLADKEKLTTLSIN